MARSPKQGAAAKEHPMAAAATKNENRQLVPARTMRPTVAPGEHFDPTILAGQVAPSTMAMYTRDFRAYVRFAGGFAQATQASTLALWRTELANQRKSPNTINRMLSAVKRLLREAATQGYVPHETAAEFSAVPGVKVSAMRDKLKGNARTRITPAQMRSLVETPDTTALPGLMHRALLLTLATSGLRISEAVTLRRAQIQVRNHGGSERYSAAYGRACFVEVLGKGQAEPRQAPLGLEAFDAIEAWLARRPVVSNYIFTGFGGRGGRDPRIDPIRPQSAWEIVKRYAGQCGFADLKPHDFRRFVGTQLAARDVRQAQKALGHKSIDTTMRHYVLDELEANLTDALF